MGSRLASRRTCSDCPVGPEIAENLEVQGDEIFDLIVGDRSSGAREVFNNLTIVESRRRINRVLDSESALVRVPRDANGLPELPDDFFSSDAYRSPGVFTHAGSGRPRLGGDARW